MRFFNLTQSRLKASWFRRWWRARGSAACPATVNSSAAPEARSPKGAGRVRDYEFYGCHLMANYIGCDPAALADGPRLKAAFEAAIEAAGATILQRTDYTFDTGGMTAVMLLAESHASIHTYPEHQACFVDLFTCGRNCRAEKFDEVLRGYLRPQHVQRRTMLRNEDGVEETPLSESDYWTAECAV